MKRLSIINLRRAILFPWIALAGFPALAQHPAFLVPGAEKMLLGVFALRHPDVIDELGLPRREFEELYSKLHAQVILPLPENSHETLRIASPTAEQRQSLNWLLLDSLTPEQGQRLVQLQNREAVAIASARSDQRFMLVPMPLFAPEVRQRLGVDKVATQVLEGDSLAAREKLANLVNEHHRAIVDQIEKFTRRLETMVGEEERAMLARVLGRPMVEKLRAATWDDSVWDRFLQQLMERRPLLVSELWLDDSAVSADNSVSKKKLFDALLREPEAARAELNLTRAQIEIIETALGLMERRIALDDPELPLRTPEPASSLEAMLQRVEMSFEKERLNASKARQLRQDFIATLNAPQKQRYRELMNQVIVGDIPAPWLLLEPSVRDHLRLDLERSRRVEEEKDAFVRRMETARERLRQEFQSFYQQVENDALAVLTADRQAKYREWFGRPFVFERRTISLLAQLKTDVSSKPK